MNKMPDTPSLPNVEKLVEELRRQGVALSSPSAGMFPAGELMLKAAEALQRLSQEGGWRATSGSGSREKWWEVADSETVWRVCHLRRRKCNRCPANEDAGDGDGTYTRGCYLQAVECVNTVETGNPWRKTEDVKPPWIVRSPPPPAQEEGR
jgi:hypothetical protein